MYLYNNQPHQIKHIVAGYSIMDMVIVRTNKKLETTP